MITYPDRVVEENELYRTVEHRHENDGVTYKTIEKQRIHCGRVLFTKVNEWNSKDGYTRKEF